MACGRSMCCRNVSFLLLILSLNIVLGRSQALRPLRAGPAMQVPLSQKLKHGTVRLLLHRTNAEIHPKCQLTTITSTTILLQILLLLLLLLLLLRRVKIERCRFTPRREVRSLACGRTVGRFSFSGRSLWQENARTSSSAIAEGPRHALSQLKSCQLLHNCTKNHI